MNHVQQTRLTCMDAANFGEVCYGDALTIRTSIIGHELNTNLSLLNWFLNEPGSVKGYQSAFFSGLPTVEIAKVLEKFIFPNTSLTGLYHLSSHPIDKFSLLQLIASSYKKDVK